MTLLEKIIDYLDGRINNIYEISYDATTKTLILPSDIAHIENGVLIISK